MVVEWADRPIDAGEVGGPNGLAVKALDDRFANSQIRQDRCLGVEGDVSEIRARRLSDAGVLYCRDPLECVGINTNVEAVDLTVHKGSGCRVNGDGTESDLVQEWLRPPPLVIGDQGQKLFGLV